MSPGGQRRGNFKYETAVNDESMEFSVENESDSNIKYTSTPMKRVNRLQRQLSAPPINFDSEESTDVKTSVRHLPRRKSTSKNLKERKDRVSGIRKIENEDRGRKRRRKSRRRRSGEDATIADRSRGENYEAGRLRKDNNFHEQEEKSAELPITELLRKAQENQKNLVQTRYEEPIPFTELTTDTIYVQGEKGFSAIKIGNSRNVRSRNERFSKPVHVAIRVYNLSKNVTLCCQGLLGGIALSQIILVIKIYNDLSILEKINATNYPGIISAIFLFLNTICLLSAIDRIDLGHLDLEQIREISCNRCMTIVTLPLYLAAICIHLTEMNNVENLIIRAQGLGGSTNADVNSEYFTLGEMHTWKLSLCIAAWICVSLGPSDDMTATHLEAMKKYAN